MKIQSNYSTTSFTARFANDTATMRILKNILDLNNEKGNFAVYKTIKCLENMKSEDNIAIDHAIDSCGYIISNTKTGAKVTVDSLSGPYGLYIAISKNLTKLFEDTSIKNPNGHKFVKLSKLKPNNNYLQKIRKKTENPTIQDNINKLRAENNTHKKQIEANKKQIEKLKRQQQINAGEYIFSLIG